MNLFTLSLLKLLKDFSKKIFPIDLFFILINKDLLAR